MANKEKYYAYYKITGNEVKLEIAVKYLRNGKMIEIPPFPFETLAAYDYPDALWNYPDIEIYPGLSEIIDDCYGTIENYIELSVKHAVLKHDKELKIQEIRKEGLQRIMDCRNRFGDWSESRVIV